MMLATTTTTTPQSRKFPHQTSPLNLRLSVGQDTFFQSKVATLPQPSRHVQLLQLSKELGVQLLLQML